MAGEMGIFEVIYHTRAMRRMRPDPVPEDVLLKLVDAARQAASGSNAQPSRWLVVRDPDQRRRVAELNKVSVADYLRQRAVRPLLPHQDALRQQRIGEAVQWQADHLHEVPALIFACLEVGEQRTESFAAGLNAGGSVWPAVQNLLLAARALGLGATPTTLALRDRPAIKSVLGLPETIEPVCLIPVGYPMGRFGPVTRRPLDQILRWDRWS